jgi:DNA-3-methyladenine glycosylase II
MDRWDSGEYHRVLIVRDQPFEIAVTQTGRAALKVTTQPKPADAHTKQAIEEQVENMLGLHQSLSRFYRFAAGQPRLAPLVNRFRGTKPPRFLSVFEALINGIACQQLSLSVGIQLLSRLARNFGLSVGVSAA